MPYNFLESKQDDIYTDDWTAKTIPELNPTMYCCISLHGLNELMIVTPLVEDLKLKKEERIKQFADIKGQIEIINGEILGYSQITNTVNLEEQDLSTRRLGEYQSHLRSLQKEKVKSHWLMHFSFFYQLMGPITI